MKRVKLPLGFKAGHANDDFTGVTVITGGRFVGGCDVRGGAPGTREIALLNPLKMMNEVHAVVLSGGSVYGLESACGVVRALKRDNIGYVVGDKIAPIVPAAVIYDLNDKEYHFPDAQMGERAYLNATDEVTLGSVGVGKGATVAKMNGLENCTKSGIGGCTLTVGEATISALICVNAFGEIYDHANGRKIVECTKNDENANVVKGVMGANTTIGCIMTDAKLDKVHANKLASIAHNGLARTIFPVHTDYDGDTIFALSGGDKEVDFTLLSSCCVECVMCAVEGIFL